MAAATAQRVALSLSGGGHLLPYHLAICETLLSASRNDIFPRIQAVSGSSSGAICATLAARIPHSLEEYANQLIQDRGNALQTLQEYLLSSTNEDFKKEDPRHIKLYICTTKCVDGTLHLFDADTLENDEELLKCVRASCTIPKTFHPMDVLESSGHLCYPDSDGILVRGEYHVDGGIAAPAPPVPCNDDQVIVVSPISCSILSNDDNRISPKDSSFAMFWKDLKCRGDFLVRPSMQNLKALRVASGTTTSTELQSWYNQGVQDATDFVSEWKNRHV